MKANELMIGDWVHCAKLDYAPENYVANMQVKQLHVADLDTYSFKELKYEEIEPIPLTVEILQSNGFTIHLSHCGIKWLWIEKQKFELAIDEENENKITTALGLIDIEIKYVHELQHALKLCRIDKNIEL